LLRAQNVLKLITFYVLILCRCTHSFRDSNRRPKWKFSVATSWPLVWIDPMELLGPATKDRNWRKKWTCAKQGDRLSSYSSYTIVPDCRMSKRRNGTRNFVIDWFFYFIFYFLFTWCVLGLY
jgi:hypothetical protein